MIAIKDIKMPVNCEECFARILAWCLLDEEERMVIPALPDESFEGRPEWCPLVDVPDEAGNCSEVPNNSDCVSKRAAVEAIANQSRFSAEEIINICDKSVQDENGWLGGLKEAILAVLELTAAQPETDLQSTCNQLATERYEDLCEYFGNQDDPILTDRREFKRWLDRIRWHVKKVDELARRSEDEWCTDCPAYDHEKHCCPRFNRVIQETVKEIRAERMKGRWIDMGDFEQCSVCGGTHLKEFQSYYGKTKWIKTNYCPNCGVIMDGESDETD